METTIKKYRPTTKYKTIPGLSITNQELRERVKNRAIIINQGGKNYTDDLTIANTLKKSQVEIARDLIKAERKNQELYQKIEAKVNASKAKKAEESKNESKPSQPETEKK